MRVAVLALLFLLSACAGQSPVIQVESVRFHHLDGGPRSFVLLPQADQPPDPAFTSAADQIVTALTRLGWRQADHADAADTIVRFRYGVDAPVEETVLSPSPLPPLSPWWGYRRRWDDPFPSWQADRVIYVPKWLAMTIVDAADATRPPLFDGRATSRRGDAAIGPILPYLVRGMMDGFPGPSGVTERKALPVQP